MGDRLGSLLVAEGVVTGEQVDEALRHQIVHGGRLGTNLVDLTGLHLDTLAIVLGRQHGLPPARESHFDGRIQELAAQLSPERAARWHVIPLYLAGERGDAVVVASTDPLPADAIRELEEAFGRKVVGGIAPELRIVYWLERVYGIERVNRFKRIGRSPTGEEVERPPTDPERRRYVHTLADSEPPTPPSQLARIAVRTIQVPISGPIDLPPDARSVDDVIKAIRRANSRSRVGGLVINALRHGFDECFDAGMLLIVRDGLALGWKGFVRDRGDEVIEAVAVPLDEPSVLAGPYRDRRAHIGELDEPAVLDQRLWKLLGTGRPAEIAALPIAIFDDIAALLYAQSPDRIPPSDAGALADLTQAMSAALHRLHAASQR